MLKRFRRATKESNDGTRSPQEKLGDELGVLEEIGRHGGLIRFGAPTRCPNCGNYGLIEEIVGDEQSNKCPNCAATWSFSRKAVALYESVKPSTTGQKVIGSGVLVNDISGLARMTRERFVDLGSAMRRTRDVIFGPPRKRKDRQ
ncbi:MAG: hypothetical protein N2037_12840 [Acidimicrobiales bacterium]|nr:hypothetical protein [Acidimicrobiales bacterium]